MAIELTLDNSQCSEPVSAVRIGLARTVIVPKNVVHKKYKLEAEELVFTTSGSLPGNQKETRVIDLVIPQTTTEKHQSDERPQGKTRRARLTQTGKPMRLAPSYQGIFFISYKIVLRVWHGKHMSMYDIPVTVAATDVNARAPQPGLNQGPLRLDSMGNQPGR